jgi:hypothetical protein
MAKYYGKVGYANIAETGPGIWKEVITERMYYGDVLKISRRLVNSESVNDNLQVNNEISIVADPFAYENFVNIRYIKWSGVLWKVSNIVVLRPRLILSLGGVYNGESGPAA